MSPLTFASPLSALRGVGPQRAAALADAGCRTVGELLLRVPMRYEDRSAPRRAAEIRAGGPATLTGRLRKVRTIRLRGRRAMVRAELLDDSGTLPVVWFNRPYMARQINESTEYLLHGQVRATGKRADSLELMNPSCERLDAVTQGDRWAPVYRSLAPGLGPALLRDLIQRALDGLLDCEAGQEEAGDPIPQRLLDCYALPTLHESLFALHRPSADADATALQSRATPHHQRLIYGELLALQLRLALARLRASRPKPHRYRGTGAATAIQAALPFALTGAQSRVLAEIRADLCVAPPMRRLLQGDVGSGKTAVAALAIAEALDSGLQAAFMAPTELLAEQHYQVLQGWLGERWRIALLTGSATTADRSRQALAAGAIDLAVGTHALIQGSVALPRLALAVIDEQQRFGVEQRQALTAKGPDQGQGVDLLVMTATPIPRSLALTAYGDLDLSLIDELPPGRSPITTEVLAVAQRKVVHARLRAAIEAGEQAYVVYPLIEKSGKVRAAALEREGEALQKVLAGLPVGTLHGRLPAEERARIAADFAAGRLRVLLATTVIEVGIDVPAATWMVIESAERFGLAQLHQLRGRVGRSDRPSRCVALHGRLNEEAGQRLRVFAATQDGFAIAEADLAQRGPGELAGSRQAGYATLAVADPVVDRQWLERARTDAHALLAERGEEGVRSLLLDPVD